MDWYKKIIRGIKGRRKKQEIVFLDVKINLIVEKTLLDSPQLSSILQITPFGGEVDSQLSFQSSEIQREWYRIFVEELDRGDSEVTPNLIDYDDLLGINQ